VPMPQLRSGIAIGRRAGRAVCLTIQGGKASLVLDRQIDRPIGMPVAETLRALLEELPGVAQGSPVGIVLASGDLACDDVWQAPQGMKARDIAAVAPVLLEARAAGETLEGLSVDIRLSREQLEVAALDNKTLREIQEAVRSKALTLELVTSIPAAIAEVFPRESRIALLWAGQRVEVDRREGPLRWRAVPMDRVRGEEGSPTLSHQGLGLRPGQVAAVAAALAHPDLVPNVLRGAPEAPRTFEEKFRRPLRMLGFAAALLLVAAGLSFRVQEQCFRAELAAARNREAELWKFHFSDRTYVKGDLLRVAKEKLQGSGLAPGDGTIPSALCFWMELGRYLPDVESLGMTLETLDLSPEGGRLSATVAAVPTDTLRNAALLEAKLNDSQKIAVRGDFETRGSDVQVRLKMDYRPR